jgi:hypothetical protein
LGVNWNLTANPDPFVTGTIALTNVSGVTNDYLVAVFLPIFPAIGPTSLTGGSVSGSYTSDSTAGSLSTVPGSAWYTPLIDGLPYLAGQLYPHLSSVSAGAFGSAPVPAASFGNPIPSQLGPAVTTSIGIQLHFRLTPGDQASFTSVFVVEPVPEPSTVVLAGMGLVGVALVAIRRRRS